jgi:hypothetical protein
MPCQIAATETEACTISRPLRSAQARRLQSRVLIPFFLLGTGNGTKLVMTTDNDLFEVNNVEAGESGASGGVSFQDLEIGYSTGLTSGAAIRVNGGSQNGRLLRVILTDFRRSEAVVFFGLYKCSPSGVSPLRGPRPSGLVVRTTTGLRFENASTEVTNRAAKKYSGKLAFMVYLA